MRIRAMQAIAALGLIAVLVGPALAAGPTSTLYVMNFGEFAGGTVQGLDLFQGLSESSFPSGNFVDTCIGVAGGDVRTMGYTDTYSGSRFNLAGGTLAGGPYLNSIANSQLHDGTSDGLRNYSVNYTNGDVLEFDRNWASPTVLFNAANSLPGAGYITMNALDGSFWLSQWGGPDRVEHRTHAGLLLSSFNSGIVGSSGLALDPADGTLWMSNGSNTLCQFSQAGSLLQSQAYSLNGSLLGMEFATTPVPEPSILALLGACAIALLGCVWRRRTMFTALRVWPQSMVPDVLERHQHTIG
jgi:hypothetical protein